MTLGWVSREEDTRAIRAGWDPLGGEEQSAFLQRHDAAPSANPLFDKQFTDLFHALGSDGEPLTLEVLRKAIAKLKEPSEPQPTISFTEGWSDEKHWFEVNGVRFGTVEATEWAIRRVVLGLPIN